MHSRRRRQQIGAVTLAIVAAFAVLAPATSASGQDLGAALGSAEANAARAEAQVAEAQARIAPARQRYAAASAQARPARRAARVAGGGLRARKASIAARRRAAEGQIARIEDNHRSEAEEHDDAVKGGIGLALAALVVAGLALGWDWLRASAGVAWLVGQQRSQAIGLCVGGGLVVLIVGAALSGAGGVLGVIGAFVVVLGPLLAFALLTARHSAQVQAARERPLLRRKRLPPWLMKSLAGLAGVLCLTLLVGTIFSSSPQATHVSAEVKHTAAGTVTPDAKRALAKAEVQVAMLQRRAGRLIARQNAARAVLRRTRGELASAQSQLAAANGDIRRYAQRIEVSERREARQREAEERKATEEIERAQACDPNYEGECLKDGIGDYDCAGGSGNGPNYVYSEVRVVGVDVFGLDANGNGIGCEGE